jgi:hypothetical protein
MKSKLILFKVVEVILTPITILTAIYIKFLTKGGIHKTIFADKIFLSLGVLPILNSGVFVHIHDIFSPKFDCRQENIKL